MPTVPLFVPIGGAEVATHTEALAILTRLARDGKVTVAIALEKKRSEASNPPRSGDLPPWLTSR